MSAWQEAWAKRWPQANAAFAALHREQPYAVEPMLGLGFVARAEGRRADARRWLSQASAVEPSADVRAQLEATEWDRPTMVDLSAGVAAVSGTQQTEWSAGVVAPVTDQLAVNARFGVLGAGDPLRGILPSLNAGGRATVVAAGAAVRPRDGLTLSGRLERWASPSTSDTFLWLDGASAVGSLATVHLLARPVSGSAGAARMGAGVDALLHGGHLLSAEIMQGVRGAPFEARTTARLTDIYSPFRDATFRFGVVRDADRRFAATTAVATATRYLSSRAGVHVDAAVRGGAFARNSFGTGLVVRW